MSDTPCQRPTPLVPDYEMLRCIGRGAYGEVWLARSMLGKLRAVKVIYRDAFDSDDPYLREFAGIREFEPVSAHESQVRVYHIGQNAQLYYFYYVMDLADDASLAARAAAAETPENKTPSRSVVPDEYVPCTLSLRLKEDERLPVKECLDMAVGLASALQHLHENGLVHRDIKPANIVFVNGQPKLADIGLVANSSNASTFIGTTGYIPPEGPGRPQADLYSFGKVLYEMATGCDRLNFPKLPEHFTTLTERAQLLELNEIILKACQNNPDERYSSAEELLRDLRTLQEGDSLRDQRRRGKWIAAGAVASGVFALFLGVLAWWSGWLPPQSHGTRSPLPPGLIHWWPCNGDARDVIGHAHGILRNGAAFVPGKVGQALSGVMEIPDAEDLGFGPGQPFSFELWVCPTNTVINPQHLFGKREGRSIPYQMAASGPELGFGSSNDRGAVVGREVLQSNQ